MNTLDALKENGPWVGMSQLVKLTGKEATMLRAELKTLMAEGKVQKTGNKRGTKYALPGATAPVQKTNDDFKKQILEVMEELKEKVSRKTLCERIGTYDAKIRPSLLDLVASGEVCHNDKKKGQLFWLKNHQDKGLIEEEKEEEKEEPVAKQEISEEDKPEIKDIEELVFLGISNIPLRSHLLVNEVKDAIFKSAKHSFTLQDVFKTFTKMLKAGRLPHVKYEQMDIGDGNRIYFQFEDAA